MKLALFGATGKTGGRVLEMALDQGHEVAALVRGADRLSARDRLDVVDGDLLNPEAVERTIVGSQAVIFAAGPVKGAPKEMIRIAAENVLTAMKKQHVERLVWLTGAGVLDERDKPALSRRIIRGLMKVAAGAVLRESEAAYQLVIDSGVDYTVARPPMLADEPGGRNLTGSYTPPKPIPVGRGDLAAFLLRCAAEHEFSRESPMLSYTERTK